MFMILRTSPCYMRQVQSSISPSNSQNISVNSEAWLTASPEQNQTVSEQYFQYPLLWAERRWDSGLDRRRFLSQPLPTGPVTLDTSLNLSEPWHSHFENTGLWRI